MARISLLALVLAAAVGLVPLVPEDHVHEVDDHGHVEFVVHRHADPHATPARATAHHRGPDLDHQDPPVATLDQAYVVPAGTRLPVATTVPVGAVIDRPVPVRLRYAGFVERLIHGPPRAPTGVRGPPSLLPC